MKISMVLISSSGGGAEESTWRLVKELRLTGNQVEVLVCKSGGTRDAYSQELTSSNYSFVPVNVLIAACNLRRHMISEEPEILHIHCERPELVTALAMFGMARPQRVVITEHNRKPWVSNRFIGLATRRYLRSKGAVWVTCFEDSDHPNRIVIRNPIESRLQSTFHNNKDIERSESTDKRIVYVGRLSKVKRVHWLIEASARMKYTGKILVIGDGPERPRLEKLAGEKGIRVEFLGFLSDPWGQVTSSDLVVNPSSYEGEPLVLLEAIARNFALAVSRIDAHTALLPNFKGMFSTIDELCLVLQNNDVNCFQVSLDLRKRLMEDRAPQKVLEQLMKVYGEMLSRETN